MDKNPHISQAVKAMDGVVAAAKTLGIKNYQTIQQWRRTGNVPPGYARAMEEHSGVSRKLLCREWQSIWPDLATSAPAAAPHQESTEERRTHA